MTDRQIDDNSDVPDEQECLDRLADYWARLHTIERGAPELLAKIEHALRMLDGGESEEAVELRGQFCESRIKANEAIAGYQVALPNLAGAEGIGSTLPSVAKEARGPILVSLEFHLDTVGPLIDKAEEAHNDAKTPDPDDIPPDLLAG
ncbi:hypothetical protein [Burkholderia ambifaria]|jgi:hypothetical protein|uniref:hypothetical protein n=1 Tax=Burkholderia ambifaria TaxID=152480 RepID=UPI00158C00E2|nr:hypothetical protein [Burkholderia ambifaria]